MAVEALAVALFSLFGVWWCCRGRSLRLSRFCAPLVRCLVLLTKNNHPQHTCGPTRRKTRRFTHRSPHHSTQPQPQPPPHLQQEHRDRQQPPQHVREPVAELVHERLERLARLGHGDDARGAHVVDAVVRVVDAAGVDDLLAAARGERGEGAMCMVFDGGGV